MASSLGAAVKDKFGVTAHLKEGHNGIYEVSVNSKMIYTNQSKCGRLPENEEIFREIRKYKDPLHGEDMIKNTSGKESIMASCCCTPASGKGHEKNNLTNPGGLNDRSDNPMSQITSGCCGPSDKVTPESDKFSCCGPQLIALSSIIPSAKKRQVDIDFMYIDLSICNRCQGTENNLEGALSEVTRVLEAADVEVSVHKIHVQSEQQARELEFKSSPTIRVNGRDIQMDVKESLCESCGDLCGDEVDCRVWVYHGKEYTVPPKAMIIDGILRELYRSPDEKKKVNKIAYRLPDNLKRFFAAMGEKQGAEEPS